MRKFFVCAGWLALLFASPPTAHAGSLFFTPDELQRIVSETQKSGPPRTAPSAEAVRLDAILYKAADDWTVWLQDEAWTPQTDRPNLHIIAVTPDSVKLALTPTAGGTTQEITLKPHQIYDPATDQVSESGT